MPNNEVSYLFYLYELSSAGSASSKLDTDFDFDIYGNNEVINVSKESIVITSVDGSDFYAPLLIEFSGNNLRKGFDGKFNCDEYVTEA